MVQWKVPKGGSSGETGIPWQPIQVNLSNAKTLRVKSNDTPPDNKQHSGSSKKHSKYQLWILKLSLSKKEKSCAHNPPITPLTLA